MKVSIKYLKTNYVEVRENVTDILFSGGRMIVESENQCSAFYPNDEIEILVENN